MAKPALVDIALINKDGVDYATLMFKPPKPGATLPGHAIVGHFPVSEGQPNWKRFSPNRPFIDLFTKYMKGRLKTIPEILTAARVNPGDYVYVIDRRTPTPQGDVPFRDIIGWYKSAQDGRPQADTFEYNADHLLVLEDGTFSSVLSDSRVEGAVLEGP